MLTRSPGPLAATAMLLTGACLAFAAEPPVAAKAPYETETWAKARTLVWGKGNVDPRKLDLGDPGNWLADGKPATSWPDAGTDLVVPAGARAAWRGSKVVCRHLTVERDASFTVPKVRLEIHGNFHVKKGGRVYFQPLVFTGLRHTFARVDNTLDDFVVKGNADKRVVAPWILVQKGGGGSVEFQGEFASNDEFKFNEGTAIVGPGAQVTAGPASIQIIGPEAVLEIQSGGTFEKRRNARHDNPDVLVQGVLRAGSPDRPLTRDAHLGISVKFSETQERGFQPSTGRYNPAPNKYTSRFIGSGQAAFGLLVEPGGKLRVFTRDPRAARLVIGYHGHGGRRDESAVEGKISAALLGDVNLNGVLLDDFRKGGVAVPDLAAVKRWPSLAFGPHNEAGPAELFAPYSPAAGATP